MPCVFCKMGVCVDPSHVVRLWSPSKPVQLFDVSGRSLGFLLNVPPLDEPPPLLVEDEEEDEDAKIDRIRREEDEQTERFFAKNPELLRGCLFHAAPKMAPVPSLIHFVWLGGPLGESRLGKVVQWAKKNPKWTVMVWTDPSLITSNTLRSSRAEIAQLQGLPAAGVTRTVLDAHYGNNAAIEDMVPLKRLKPLELTLTKFLTYKTSEDFHLNLAVDRLLARKFKPADELAGRIIKEAQKKIDQAGEEFRQLSSMGIAVNDVRDLLGGGVRKWYRWETRLGWTNYGAASDLARLCILEQWGGLYLDVDLECVKPLGELPCAPDLARIGPLIDDETISHHKLPTVSGTYFLESSWKKAQILKLIETLENNVNHSFNNNVIASHPRSKFIQRYLDQCVANYTAGVVKPSFMEAHWGGDPENTKLSTVGTTGPHVIEGLMMKVPGLCKGCAKDNGLALRTALKFPPGIIGWLTDISASRDWL